MESYQIAGVVEANEKHGILVNIIVNGSAKRFQKNIQEIYTKEWLHKFSHEDVAHLGFLIAVEYKGDFELVKQFPRKKNFISKNVVFLGMFFVCFLILSNLTAFKIGAINVPFFNTTIEFPSALIFFPITYAFSNVLTEVYGYKITRLIIWCGFLCSAVVLLGFWAVVKVPASEVWMVNTNNAQSAYEVLFTAYARIFVASSIAYFLGEFINSMVLARLKVLTAGKHLYARVVGSTMAAVSVDSFIFCLIAFYGVMTNSSVFGIVITQITFKVIYEIVMLPLTYKIVAYLKNKDSIDYYDVNTKFNPFSLKTDD
ncbi:queuosine precursor transporter [Glaciimonas sp. GG7]